MPPGQAGVTPDAPYQTALRVVAIEGQVNQLAGDIGDVKAGMLAVVQKLDDVTRLIANEENMRRDMDRLLSQLDGAKEDAARCWRDHATETETHRGKLEEWKGKVNRVIWISIGGGMVAAGVISYFLYALNEIVSSAATARSRIETQQRTDQSANVIHFQQIDRELAVKDNSYGR